MRAAPRLEDARDEAPEGAAREARGKRQEEVQRVWRDGHRADDDGEEGAEQELAVGADVEQAGPETKCDGQTGKDERRRVVQGRAERLEAAE